MKGFTRNSYGGPEILQLEEIEKPKAEIGHIVIKVFANSANPADWHILRGKPFFARFTFGLFKPKDKVIGADFAGVVIETGENITRFKLGDKVFGETLKGGAFAEYVSVPETVCALIPEGADLSEMATLPTAGLTALQAIITHGQLKQGETVLINGASGGVGHIAVQIAKAYGGSVTAVCSGRNIEFVRSLGADKLIAYDRENIHEHHGRYDLVLDTNGNLDYGDFQRMGKRAVLTGFTSMSHMVSVLLRKAVGKIPLIQFTAEANANDLNTLATLIKEGKLKPHIERTYSYKEIPQAISYIEEMRTRGKVVMIWNDKER
jgi:NADPH:quinone reductase-like Zn-dependent oxidoreductase